MPWILDASIAAAWCFEDEQSPATELLFDRLVSDPATVPALFPIEIANVLTQALRKKPPRINSSKRTQFLETLAQLAIHVDPDTNRHAWSDTLTLADRHKLSVYDAAYLELALRNNCEHRFPGYRSPYRREIRRRHRHSFESESQISLPPSLNR